MNRHLPRILALVCLAFATSLAAAPPPPKPVPPPAPDHWPREVKLSTAAILIYQPQVNSWLDNKIELRAALAIKPVGADVEAFGVVFATAHTRIDKATRRVVLENLRITKNDFPTLPDRGAAYAAELTSVSRLACAASRSTVSSNRRRSPEPRRLPRRC